LATAEKSEDWTCVWTVSVLGMIQRPVPMSEDIGGGEGLQVAAYRRYERAPIYSVAIVRLRGTLALEKCLRQRTVHRVA